MKHRPFLLPTAWEKGLIGECDLLGGRIGITRVIKLFRGNKYPGQVTVTAQHNHRSADRLWTVTVTAYTYFSGMALSEG